MSYSITPLLHFHKDKQGLHKIVIQVIYRRSKVYIGTDYRVKDNQFENTQVVNHPNSTKINANVRKQVADIESKILDALRDDATIKNIKEVFKQTERKVTSISLYDYILELSDRYTGKLSHGTIRHYNSLAAKILSWFPEIKLDQVSVKWLETFEAKLREPKKKNGTELIMDSNTVNSNMKRLKSILNKASLEGLIKEEQFKRYKVPLYRQKLVEYLTEDELNKLTKLIKVIDKPGHRIAGWYFLLSCYTGWRISDVKRFDYDKMVSGDKVILRAKKNAQIVSIPVHSRLIPVLRFTKQHSFDLSEQKARMYIKELCSLAGIKKDISFHTGRHSFGMLLMANGFTIDEAAELLGDSSIVAKVYARVHNESLDKKIREKLG